MTSGAVTAGADWRCRRCGQRWDSRRLTSVAAYAVWLSERTDRIIDHESDVPAIGERIR